MTTIDRERIEGHLRALEAYAFDVKPLWRDLSSRVEAWERGVPTEEDLRFTLPTTPPCITNHLCNGDRLPVELTPHLMWKGYHYTLTPGQRRWFREFTGMTPTRTVTLSWVETWPGTQHPRSFKVESDEHVPNNRRHVIKEMVVRDAGKFFVTAQQFDIEEAAEKVLRLILGPVNVWKSVHKWAVEDLCGVRLVGDEVEVIFLSDELITFQDGQKRCANVRRDEFLSTVTDYATLHSDDKKRRVRGTTKSQASPALPQFKSLEDLMENLESML